MFAIRVRSRRMGMKSGGEWPSILVGGLPAEKGGGDAHHAQKTARHGKKPPPPPEKPVRGRGEETVKGGREEHSLSFPSRRSGRETRSREDRRPERGGKRVRGKPGGKLETGKRELFRDRRKCRVAVGASRRDLDAIIRTESVDKRLIAWHPKRGGGGGGVKPESKRS